MRAGTWPVHTMPRPVEPAREPAVISAMKNDPVDNAIDQILASADGDARRALRAVLLENIALESELRTLYAASEHGALADPRKNSFH
jgi:hypothetical protein